MFLFSYAASLTQQTCHTVGAILPGMDTGNSAAAGAAVGALGGGVGGLRGRCQRRLG